MMHLPTLDMIVIGNGFGAHITAAEGEVAVREADMDHEKL